MRELIKTKYFKWGLTAGITMIAVVLVFFLLDKAATVHGALGSFMDILAPFIYGLVMAYLLRPVYNGCHYRLVKLFKKTKMSSENAADVLARIISVTVSVLLLLVIIFALFMMVIPQLMSSIYELVVSIPGNAVKLLNWVQNLNFVNDTVKSFVTNRIDVFVDGMDEWMTDTAMPYLKDLALKISEGIMGAASFLFDFIIGIVVCVYVLLSKTTFAAQAKKLSYSLFEKDTANTIINGMRYVDKVFNGFVSGNIIDALIIGGATFIVMNIFNWPFALLISTIVGVTNLIPFFGPFIGGAAGAVLLCGEKPMTAVYFLIFILILQQMDGNVIKPKVLGQKVDLASFWILFSIVVGGGLFGFIGMLLGVPVFTIIYTFVSWLVDRRLTKKNLSNNTADYADVDCYDFEKGEFKFLPENLIEERKNEKRADKQKRREERKKHLRRNKE